MYYFTITTSNISDFKLELKLNFNNFGNAHWHTVQAMLKITTGVCFRNWHVIHPWDTVKGLHSQISSHSLLMWLWEMIKLQTLISPIFLCKQSQHVNKGFQRLSEMY